jgi:hypothetical protein
MLLGPLPGHMLPVGNVTAVTVTVSVRCQRHSGYYYTKYSTCRRGFNLRL